MSEFFNIILVSLSRLLFSSPAFVKLAETSLSGAYKVQDSSGEMCFSPVGSPLFDMFPEVRISDKVGESPPLLVEAATTGLSSHDTEHRWSLEDSDLGQSGTFLNAPAVTPSPSTLGSKSAIGSTSTSTSTSLGDSTDPIIFEPHYPPSDSDDDILTLNSSSFSLSLVSDNSVDDEFNVSGSMDTLLSSPPPCSTVTLQSSKLLPHVSGLGISGLTRKDGSGPFDGLGIVSIESPTWHHLSSETRDGIDPLSDSIQGFRRRPSSFSSSAYDGSSEYEDFDQSFLGLTGDRISNIFLQETLLTFTEDPFHEQLCSSSSIDSSTSTLDCGNSWSELGLDESVLSPSMSGLVMVDTASNKSHLPNDNRPVVFDYRRRTPKLSTTTNFSSPTISSELKRSSSIIISKSTLRNRSSSWPSSTKKDTVATPRALPRCKWRV